MRTLATAILLFLGVLNAAQAQSRQEFSYGPDPKQRIDVYAASGAAPSPVIVMLHGGAWRFGDKRSPGVWQAKVAHWVPRGFTFISVNTRLLPEADPVEQTQDLAAALDFIQLNARHWGADPERLILMGHSAGAHVAALLATRNDIAAAADLRSWRGTIVLDVGALDLPDLMRSPPHRLYDRAFGRDTAFWWAASPLAHLDRADGPFLIVCSVQRRTPCAAAEAFQGTADRLGVSVTVLRQDLSHKQINTELGVSPTYTQTVADWISIQLD